MADWKEYKLKHAIERFIDYRGKTPTKTESGIPLITAKIVKDGRILEPNEFIATEGYQSWMTRGYPEINDVVLTTEAPLGEVALLKNKNVALAQRIITLRGKKGLCNNIFLKYYLQSNAGQFALQARASGSTVEGIKASELREVEIYLPPLPEQQAIAEVLSSLDDKIDLLNRQNKTLEALAETLFRQWFVEEAEESWEEKAVSEIIDVRDGTHDSPKQKEVGFHLITSKHLKPDGIDFSSAYKISEEDFISINKRSKVDKNDILFSMIGTLGLIHFVEDEPNFAIKNIGLFKSSQKPAFAKFLYLLLKSPLGNQFIYESADGSTQEYISLGSLRQLKFKYSGDLAIEQFDKTISPYFEKKFLNNKQIRILSNLRDTLLPKLMSGEVRVRL